MVFDGGDVLDDVGNGGIHRTDDVGDGFAAVPALCRRQERDAVVVEERTHRTFVMERPGGIDGADPGSHSLVIDAVAAFVAQRPNDDRRVVFVTLNGVTHALGVCCGDPGVIGNLQERMVLEICLAYEHNAVLVAQLVPIGVVGVVRGAHGVDVVGLHGADVEFHQGTWHCFAVEVAVFVVIDAVDHQWLIVDHQRPIGDFDRPEAHAQAGVDRALGAFVAHQQGVQRRRFAAP